MLHSQKFGEFIVTKYMLKYLRFLSCSVYLSSEIKLCTCYSDHCVSESNITVEVGKICYVHFFPPDGGVLNQSAGARARDT